MMRPLNLFCFFLIVGFAMSSLASMTLENSVSTYQRFSAAGAPQGFYKYAFTTEKNDGIDVAVTVIDVAGNESQFSNRVAYSDCINAHESAVRELTTCKARTLAEVRAVFRRQRG